MVAEGGITTEEVPEVLVEIAPVATEVRLQEEKEVSHLEEKIQTDLEVKEVLLHAKAVLEEEVLLPERAVFHPTEHRDPKVLKRDPQEDRKVLAIHQEKEDHEKANKFC